MKKAKAFGNILFWLTLISPLFSFSLVSTIGEANIFGVAGIIRYSWIMWLFIPLGVMSFFIGKKLKDSQQKYKKNYIIALICVPLLIIFGSYRFIFSNVSYDINKANHIAEITNLDLPKQVKITTTEFESYNLTYVKIIDSSEKISFNHMIKTNTSWSTKLSTKIKGILPYEVQFEIKGFDYFVFYNITNNEYNMYPSDGEHAIIFIAYDSEMQRLLILDDFNVVLY